MVLTSPSDLERILATPPVWWIQLLFSSGFFLVPHRGRTCSWSFSTLSPHCSLHQGQDFLVTGSLSYLVILCMVYFLLYRSPQFFRRNWLYTQVQIWCVHGGDDFRVFLCHLRPELTLNSFTRYIVYRHLGFFVFSDFVVLFFLPSFLPSFSFSIFLSLIFFFFLLSPLL